MDVKLDIVLNSENGTELRILLVIALSYNTSTK